MLYVVLIYIQYFYALVFEFIHLPLSWSMLLLLMILQYRVLVSRLFVKTLLDLSNTSVAYFATFNDSMSCIEQICN